MPRKPKIPHDRLLNAIISAEDVIDNKGCIPGPRAKVWEHINIAVEGKLTAKYIYQFVHDNRHNSYQQLKDSRGIHTPEAVVSSVDEPTEDSLTSSEEEIHKPEKSFTICLSPSEWLLIKPCPKVYNRTERKTNRKTIILPPYQWEDVIIDKLWDQHRIPCPYTFKNSYVYQSLCRKEYIKIEAYCRECRAQAKGRILHEPLEGESVMLEWRCNDSRNHEHTLKRQLRGDRRNVITTQIQYSSPSVFRRHRAGDLMQQGDQEPATLWSTDVLRKAKMERIDKDLKVVKGADPLQNLMIMKHLEPYAGSIHDIGLDKMFIHYTTPAQMMIYRQYHKHHYSVVSIDATGSLVRKLDRPHGLSGNIFLYEAVIHTGAIQLPVTQMLSEKHDANSILYWLNEWERSGAPLPKEVIIDNSAALKSAVARSFCRCPDILHYKEECFSFLIGKTTNLPSCFLRLDVAHFLNSAKMWKSWKDETTARLKDFYMRCLGLLILATSLKSFEEILKNILVLAILSQENQYSSEANVSVENSLHFLTNRIKKNNKVTNLIEETETTTNKNHNDEVVCPIEIISNQNDNAHIHHWLREIQNNIKIEANNEGNRLNPYFAPKVAEHFIRISKDFPLWSGVMVEFFNSPNLTASSAPVESDFANIKQSILRGLSRPLRIDKFIAIHLRAIEGSCRIAGSDSKKATGISVGEKRKIDRSEELDVHNGNTTNQLLEITTDDVASSDLLTFENWRGKAAVMKRVEKRKSKYLNAFPELDAAVHGHRIKQPSKRLLLNGNKTGFIELERKHFVFIKNTCAFDSICQIFASAYIDVDHYREFIDDKNNMLLKTSRSLAVEGAVKNTYRLRAIALSKVLKQNKLAFPETVPYKKIKKSYANQLDCWNNASNLAKELLDDAPSVISTRQCSSTSCLRQKIKIRNVLDTNINILLDNGFSALDRAVLDSLSINDNYDMKNCPSPCGAANLKIIHSFSDQIVIDVDYLSDPNLKNCISSNFNRNYSLEELPHVLLLGEKHYTLAGVVAYRPGHYIAYCKRKTGVWEQADDLSNQILQVKDNLQNIQPHLLIYIIANHCE